MNPSLSSPPVKQTSPTRTASIAASAAYRPLSPAASGASAAAVINAVEDSGPAER